MNTFQIDNEEINVEEIMKTIRENIKKRKEQGTYPPDIDTAIPQLSNQRLTINETGEEIENLNINCDIQNNSYVISSHRHIVGTGLVKGRQLVHGEVRRYVDPIVFKQINFNQSVARILNNAEHKLDLLQQQIKDTDQRLSEFENTIDRFDLLQQQIKDINQQLSGLENVSSKLDALQQQIVDEATDNSKLHGTIDQIRIDVNTLRSQIKTEIREGNEERMRSFVLSMNTDIENKAWLAKVLENRSVKEFSKNEESVRPPLQDTGVNYFVFEDRFRGPRDIIAQRQTAFLRYFEGCKNVLDIGCGRGEFLETMQKYGIGAHGVDLDETMVDYCRSRGLEVELDDALDYIGRLEDASLDGIFIDQVVEHLEPGYLVKLLKLCFQKMKYGFYIISETVNPLSFSSFANFYIDLTHIKPVHPETLKFLLESTGFREMEAVYSSPLPESMRLQKMMIREEVTDVEKRQLEIYNRNIEMLNATLYGAQDYAMIGKK